MEIDRCIELCDGGAGVSGVTPAGIELLQKALDLLGRPQVTDYVAVVDAFTGKDENGEPVHTEGHLNFLALGTDVTCPCALRAAMRACAYEEGEPGKYVRGGETT
jgi:hypothetical protein